MNASTSSIIADISQKAVATQNTGAFVRQQTAIGELACCSVKAHNNKGPFASYRLNWLLDNKCTALTKIVAALDAA